VKGAPPCAVIGCWPRWTGEGRAARKSKVAASEAQWQNVWPSTRLWETSEAEGNADQRLWNRCKRCSYSYEHERRSLEGSGSQIQKYGTWLHTSDCEQDRVVMIRLGPFWRNLERGVWVGSLRPGVHSKRPAKIVVAAGWDRGGGGSRAVHSGVVVRESHSHRHPTSTRDRPARDAAAMIATTHSSNVLGARRLIIRNEDGLRVEWTVRGGQRQAMAGVCRQRTGIQGGCRPCK